VFSTATRAYFDYLPELPGLDGEEARRVLSAAYADILATRDELTRDGGPPAAETLSFLRKLTATLEAYAVFPDGAGVDERRAAAFIAAETMSLAREAPREIAGEPEAEIADEEAPEERSPYRLLERHVFETVEAALLYVISGLESNGSLLVASLDPAGAGTDTAEARAAEDALNALSAFVQLGLAPEEVAAVNDAADVEPVAAVVRAAAYRRIAAAAREHLRWLRIGDDAAWTAAVDGLRESAAILSEGGAARYAEVLHLSRLLLRAIDETEERAIRRIPAPAGERYANYLGSRAISRPVIWPSGVDYVARCLPGPRLHAAVSLPTGSGKSFIAELAVSQAVLDGWALYLVPTNALAVQVRRDLASALATLEDARVRAFVGGAEYTELQEETVVDVEPGTVMVMTPEKCALALRRSPEAFQTLRLCVFDECHLISETGGRGVLAELVAAHILSVAPEVRFLLLSAMIENPEDATAWLQAATGIEALAVRTPWRPTRTLRGVLGFDRDAFRNAAEAAINSFADLPANRRNVTLEVPYAALVNLQGPWTNLSEDEYAVLRFGMNRTLTVRRDRRADGWRFEARDDGYLNPTLADVASYLRSRGERVLAFVPRNRHHAFAVAAAVAGEDGGELEETADGRLVAAYLKLAEFEMGMPTALADLIRRGVCVHSSALDDAERIASELAFQRRIATVMVATGTLAQGLNLPATVVLVGGTTIGFEATPDPDAASRTRAQLLNAIGRSGRPGVANHGLALVIPNGALSLNAENLNVPNAFQRAEVLAYEDASVPLVSRLNTLVAAALDGTLVGDAMSVDEMVAYTYLPEAEVENALSQRILQRTYGVWRSRPDAVDDTAAQVAHALQGVGQQFVAGANAPPWTTDVAYRSGLPLPDVFMLYGAAIGSANQHAPADIEGWLRRLFALLRTAPLERVQGILFGELSLAGLTFSDLAGQDPGEEAWEALVETVLRYMRGVTISDLATFATGSEAPVDAARTVGSKPIPKTLSFVQQIAYRLSLVAGGLSALWAVGEEVEPGDVWLLPPDSRWALNALPIAVRCGSADRNSLAWYRFGIRHRVAAHALARAFPVPEEQQDDAAVRAWTRQARTAWIDGANEMGQVVETDIATALRQVANYEGI
jgi:DEAD/DEAH box helicase